GLGDHITFTGMIDDPFGEGVFHAFDVVCQFSRWEEVFGWMIAEAMAHERPVVATRVGGIPELIADGESGYLVNRGDAEGMSGRVLELLNDPALRARMGRAALDTVQKKFDLKTRVGQLIETYGITISAARALGTTSNTTPLAVQSPDVRKPSRIDPLLILEDES